MHIPMPLADRILSANLRVFSTKELERFLASLDDGPATARIEDEIARREEARSVSHCHN